MKRGKTRDDSSDFVLVHCSTGLFFVTRLRRMRPRMRHSRTRASCCSRRSSSTVTTICRGHPHEQGCARRRQAAYDLRKPTSGQTDLARLKLGGVGAQFWSVYIPGETGSGFARTQLEQIDIARRIIAQYPDRLQFATSVADIRAAHDAGRIASLLGMEGGHAIEDSLGALRAYYDLGVRYMTLTHNVNTELGGLAGAAAGARRPDAVRRAGRARDEQARHAGRSVAHLRRHDGRRAARLARRR